MEVHSRELFDTDGKSTGITVPGDIVFDDGFGDAQSSFENELFQGAIEHQNWKLSLDADPVMAELVSAWRNLDSHVWLEVTLEQRAKNIPDPTPFAMAEPRKERLIWWGRLARNEATGYVDYQSYKELSELVRKPERKLHVGGLEMTFVHWLHVNFARDAESFLYYFRSLPRTYFPNHTSIFNLFYQLVRYIAPTKLVGFCDATLKEWHDWPVAHGMPVGMELPYELRSDPETTSHLTQVFVQIIEGFPSPHFTPLFFSKSDSADHQAGENSLFTRWATLGEAAVTLCREFFLKFDVELPTLREAWEVQDFSFGYDNLKKDLQNHWTSASRWAFSSLDDFPLEIKTQPLEKSIKYNPAAVWIKSVLIDVPSYSGDSGLIPTPASFTSPYGEGKDISYKTLFRFIGKSYVTGNPGDDARGIELWMFFGSGITYARSASFTRDGSTISYSYWNQFHVFKNLDLWGGARAVMEFDHESVGITPFGNSIGSFGFLDWGDFGNLRFFDASPGLLYSGSDFGRFSVIEISRKPGGNTHIRGIERKVMKSIPSIYVPPAPPPPPPPPDPPIITPPPILTGAEAICGVVQFIFGVQYGGECIDHVDFFIDGVYKSSLPGWSNMPGKIVPCPILIDTTLLANGVHQICVRVYPCDSASVMNCWNFRVTNPCTGFPAKPVHV